jgi:mRNA-degrading endonuclease toxin of MazEF toxin-antitoxin module
VDRHTIHHLLKGATQYPRGAVLEKLAHRATPPMTVADLLALLPSHQTHEMYASARMRDVGGPGSAMKSKSGATWATMLRDPTSLYRVKLERVWRDRARIEAAAAAIRRLRRGLTPEDRATNAEHRAKIVATTTRMEYRIARAVQQAAQGVYQLSHAQVDAIVAAQVRKFAKPDAEIRPLVLEAVKQYKIAIVGRPRGCARIRVVLDHQAAGKSYREAARALGLLGDERNVQYLSTSLVPQHLKRCGDCRAYKVSLGLT